MAGVTLPISGIRVTGRDSFCGIGANRSVMSAAGMGKRFSVSPGNLTVCPKPPQVGQVSPNNS